jgi:hypothetical protein
MEALEMIKQVFGEESMSHQCSSKTHFSHGNREKLGVEKSGKYGRCSSFICNDSEGDLYSKVKK